VVLVGGDPASTLPLEADGQPEPIRRVVREVPRRATPEQRPGEGDVLAGLHVDLVDLEACDLPLPVDKGRPPVPLGAGTRTSPAAGCRKHNVVRVVLDHGREISGMDSGCPAPDK